MNTLYSKKQNKTGHHRSTVQGKLFISSWTVHSNLRNRTDSEAVNTINFSASYNGRKSFDYELKLNVYLACNGLVIRPGCLHGIDCNNHTQDKRFEKRMGGCLAIWVRLTVKKMFLCDQINRMILGYTIFKA